MIFTLHYTMVRCCFIVCKYHNQRPFQHKFISPQSRKSKSFCVSFYSRYSLFHKKKLIEIWRLFSVDTLTVVQITKLYGEGKYVCGIYLGWAYFALLFPPIFLSSNSFFLTYFAQYFAAIFLLIKGFFCCIFSFWACITAVLE